MTAASLVEGIGSGLVAYFYFFIMRIVLGMLLLPIFFGFVIEAFNNNLPVVQGEQKARREALLAELTELQRMTSLALMPLPRERERQSSGHEHAVPLLGHHRGRSGEGHEVLRSKSFGPITVRSPLLVPDHHKSPQIVTLEEEETHGDAPRSESVKSRSSQGASSTAHRGYVIKSKPKASDIHWLMFGQGQGEAGKASPAGPSPTPLDLDSAHKAEVERLRGESEVHRIAAETAHKRIEWLEAELARARASL